MPSHLKSGKQRSVEASRFAMVPRNDIPRSAFDVVHGHKTTFDAGVLIPVYVDEVLPGDSFRVRMTAFARLATAIVPIMDNLIMESFFFFVPNRLLWSRWAQFMGEQADPADTTSFLVPQTVIPFNRCVPGDIVDYMGITLSGAGVGSVSVSALPFRAYNLIWNDWFRDQDLQNPVPENMGDGPDNPIDFSVLFRGKRHDYFTSARPWPQKPLNMTDMGGPGGPYIPGQKMINPQSGAPVTGLGLPAAPTINTGPFDRADSGGRTVSYERDTTSIRMRVEAGSAFPNVRVLINDIRTANMVQTMMERNARGGTRYTEIIRSHFGVISPDARLQRPEYLGGGRTMVHVNPVAQTSATSIDGSTTALGELAGVGTAVASGHGFSQSFTEHGVVLGLVSVRADLTYQHGINRMWRRRTQYDFYWPGLAHLGEQAVTSREIYADGTAGDDLVWGYQERWAEYRYKPSRVSGRFRSFAPQTLDVWHLSQNFLARPSLNNGYIIENPPMDRILAQPGAFEDFLFDSVFDIRMVRPLPMFSIPGLGPRL